MQVVPLLANPNQSLQIVLDNQNITFRFYERSTGLYMDMSKDNESVCFGQKCLFGRSIITFSQNIFKGSLHFIDMQNNHNPEYSTLGTRFYLVYLSEDEPMPQAFKW